MVPLLDKIAPVISPAETAMAGETLTGGNSSAGEILTGRTSSGR
jgi:hypothetical protein